MNKEEKLQEKIKKWDLSKAALSLFEELPKRLQHGKKLSHLSMEKIGDDSYGIRYSNTKGLFLVDTHIEELMRRALQIIKKQYPNGIYKKDSKNLAVLVNI